MSVLRIVLAPFLHTRTYSSLKKQYLLPVQFPQVRNYSSCWSCGHSDSGSSLFCPKCNSLQRIDEKRDYFDLLDLPPLNYNIDNGVLTTKFREMQSILHPDKFSNKSQEEQEISSEWSSLINKAYKTLLAPIKRGEYILHRTGMHLPQDNSALNQQFLMEMMERNEEVDEAKTDEELRRLLVKTRKELSEIHQELAKAFGDRRLEDAVAIIVRMKYFISLEGSIKDKFSD